MSGGAAPRRNLVLCLRHRQKLEDLAETAFPFEACGVLVGSVGDREVQVRSIAQVRNLEKRKLQKRYRLDLEEFGTAEREAHAKGRTVVGIWHSHPNRTPLPSYSDYVAARSGYSYLILGVAPLGTVEMRAWRLDGRIFVEEEVVVSAELPWDLDPEEAGDADGAAVDES